MSGPLNFNGIKKQMKSDGYGKQWNLRAIKVSLENKAITQQERDKLIALLYSKGKSDKLFKMRGHHLSSTYFDKIKKTMYPNAEAEIEILEIEYGKEFSNKLKRYNSQIKEDSVIEIIEGEDDVCNFCPYYEYCNNFNYKSTHQIALKRLNENYDILVKKHGVDFINKKLEFRKYLMNQDTKINDKKCLDFFNLKPGDIIILNEITPVNNIYNVPTIYQNGGFI